VIKTLCYLSSPY